MLAVDRLRERKLQCELVSRLEQDGAPLPEVLVEFFNLFLDGTPFDGAVGVLDVDAGHGSTLMDGDVGRDDFVE